MHIKVDFDDGKKKNFPLIKLTENISTNNRMLNFHANTNTAYN